ncbi:AraC family transcriptional regulator [Paraflavisolibacter sp. H34]|uniref:helix-turn-helix domain-containing protein n=1 Tax=Huijunlia imazamoxiresistens TaxID=3127457 RepID=UPI003016174E
MEPVQQTRDILSPAELAELEGGLVFETGREFPGPVGYSLRRFVRPANWLGEDRAVLNYHFHAPCPEGNFLKLQYAVSGQVDCRQYSGRGRPCPAHGQVNCSEKTGSIDVLGLEFAAAFLSQLLPPPAGSSALAGRLLSFTHTAGLCRSLPLCNKTRLVLDRLMDHDYSGTQEHLFVHAQAQLLLVYGLDYLRGEQEIRTLTCKFLADAADREKLVQAREILLRQLGSSITIKELSRKVAMNECYLKKGFKELFGTTIFEFFQNHRMEHARYLLYEKGLSVTEVAHMLGFSSISHFSTAFKKHTGLKPCELLLR